MINNSGDYAYDEHTHRFAVWAAGRAYGRKGAGLTVQLAHKLLKCGEFDRKFRLDRLPSDAAEMDEWHEQRRSMMMRMHPKLTHGRAAKLINVYVKARFSYGDTSPPELSHMHPPIDRVLLVALSKLKGKPFAAIQSGRVPAWTEFSSADYQNVIASIRVFLNGEPLWMIEKYWSPSDD